MKLRILPVLSFLLLGFQLYIPWSVKHLVTQDGPAHVYTAFMAKDLVFHRHTSPYHAVYHIQKKVIPNWTCTILLAAILGVFGPDHAEAFLMTVCLLAGYFSFAYGLRSFGARGSPWTVIANWLLQSWFLWSGFYNFYLGMVLLPLVLGYYVRHIDDFDWRRAVKLALALTGIFFTHLIPAVLAVVALFSIAGWVALWQRPGWRRLWLLTAAAAPVLALALMFAAKHTAEFTPGILAAWKSFPQAIFSFSAGRVGEQKILWPPILILIVIAIMLMRGREWRSARGGLAIAAVMAFALYLLVPDAGFGGSAAKMRFAWAVFIFGGLLLCTVDRLQPLQTVVGLYVAFLLAWQLTLVESHVKSTSDAVDSYLAATDRIEPGSRFVRVDYPAPDRGSRFQTNTLGFNPLLHVDALGAAKRHAADLSDYQSASGTFGVDFKAEINDGQRYSLWGLEGPGADTPKVLDWLRGGLPVKVDYVVLVGEDKSADYRAMVADLERKAKLAGVNRGAEFVRLYKFVQ